MDPENLPEELQGIEGTTPGYVGEQNNGTAKLEPVFIRVVWSPKDDSTKPWKLEGEFRGQKVAEYANSYRHSPYTPLRYSAIAGENYGRSLIEENLGVIRSLEGISAALVDIADASSQVIPLVDPSGVLEVADLLDRENLEPVSGRDTDLNIKHLGNPGQTQTLLAYFELLSQEVGRIFLVDSSTQPTGERVTAFQSRVFAEEHFQALSGVLTGLTRELMIPVIQFRMDLMVDGERLPAEVRDSVAPNGAATIRVRSGLEALDREIQNQKLVQFVEFLSVMPPEEIQDDVIWRGIIDRYAATLIYNTEGVLKDPEQAASDRQQRNAAALQQQAGEQAIQSAGAIAEAQATSET